MSRFASVTIDQAAEWTASYFNVTDVGLAQSTSKKPPMYIAETGWPTVRSFSGLLAGSPKPPEADCATVFHQNSSTSAAMQNGGGAAASVANLQVRTVPFHHIPGCLTSQRCVRRSWIDSCVKQTLTTRVISSLN